MRLSNLQILTHSLRFIFSHFDDEGESNTLEIYVLHDLKWFSVHVCVCVCELDGQIKSYLSIESNAIYERNQSFGMIDKD